jgi:GNAT superfamily N-acetyltransferase
MSGFTVRRYRPGDGERVRTLNETALRAVDAYAEDAPEEDLDDVAGAYLDGSGEFLVGERDGEVVAMGALTPVHEGTTSVRLGLLDPTVDAVEVTRMRVHPDHWRQGYGSAVLRELERRAQALGYGTAVLDTTARQTGARRFYEAHGYEAVGRTEWREFEMLCYRKPL